MEAILVALEERVGRQTHASEEITLTQNIFHILRLQKSYGPISIPALMHPESSGQCGGEGLSGAPDGRGGAGPSRISDRSDLKRSRQSEGSENTKKRRN
jgi:hypothetical protein